MIHFLTYLEVGQQCVTFFSVNQQLVDPCPQSVIHILQKLLDKYLYVCNGPLFWGGGRGVKFQEWPFFLGGSVNYAIFYHDFAKISKIRVGEITIFGFRGEDLQAPKSHAFVCKYCWSHKISYSSALLQENTLKDHDRDGLVYTLCAQITRISCKINARFPRINCAQALKSKRLHSIWYIIWIPTFSSCINWSLKAHTSTLPFQ